MIDYMPLSVSDVLVALAICVLMVVIRLVIDRRQVRKTQSQPPSTTRRWATQVTRGWHFVSKDAVVEVDEGEVRLLDQANGGSVIDTGPADQVKLGTWFGTRGGASITFAEDRARKYNLTMQPRRFSLDMGVLSDRSTRELVTAVETAQQ